MKRLMIIGASILQLPAIKKAKEMGLYVGVADYNPKAIGIQYADEYFNVSTIDEKGICEVTRKFKADGIITLATDMPMRALAYTSEQLGLVGIDYVTAVKATDKGKMIKAFEEDNVEHPWFYILNDNEHIPKGITFPCITKPTDNSGSRGVMLVNTADELKGAIGYSSGNGRSGSVIVEEYMQGPEVSVEVMVINGVAHVLQITDKLTTGTPYFVEMGHSQPCQLSETTIEAIINLAERAALAVGIKNGPAHIEIIVTENGPKIVELGARLGGDNITTHLVPLSTGINMVEGCIKIALGEKPNLERKFNKGAAIRYLKTDLGVITSISGIKDAENIDGVKQVSIVYGVGNQATEIKSSADRVGFVIAQSTNPEKAIEICEVAMNKITINVR